MSGETEDHVSGWTVDTLQDHLQRQIDSNTVLVERTTTASQGHLQRQIDDMQEQLERRFQREYQAVDLAFNIHREATKESVTQTEKALQAALISAEKAVQTALASAEKAVTKAEEASTKRFESVNEFRGQLSDQVRTFMTRNEANAVASSLNERVTSEGVRVTERIEEVSQRMADETLRVTQRFEDTNTRLGEAVERAALRYNEIETRITSRLDRMAGISEGKAESKMSARLDLTQFVGLVGMVVGIVSIGLAILLASGH
jgi:hypothetical protein